MNKKILNYFLLDQLQLSHSVFLTVYTSVGYLHMTDVLSLVLLLENLHVNKSLAFWQVGLFCHHTIMTFLQIARHSIGDCILLQSGTIWPNFIVHAAFINPVGR